MISARQLEFAYKKGSPPALKDISFTTQKGSLVCLAGANGSGKTTLLSLLTSIFQTFKGDLQINGLCAKSEPEQIKSLVAFVPQNPDIYLLGATVQEDLLLGFSKQQRQNGEFLTASCAMLERFGLLKCKETPVHQLSYGEKRKLCLASALLKDPLVLLLDEPFAGLDFSSILELRALLEKNRLQGVTQLVSSHDLELMADLADTFLLLSKGQIAVEGDAEMVFPHLARHNVRPPCYWLAGEKAPAWLRHDLDKQNLSTLK